MLTRTLPLVGLLSLAAIASAEDWPQWQGPRRDNVSTETGLLKQWPAGGPRLLWTFSNAGFGYSGPAIVGDRLYTMGTEGDHGCVFALDVSTGKEVWRSRTGPLFKNAWGGGPRSTPTVDRERLYALDAQGILVCLETASGKEVWRKHLIEDLGGQKPTGKRPFWGYAESPLVDGGQVVCSPGGSQGTLAALDKKTGEVLWRSEGLTDDATYSSIVIAEVGGIRQYVQMTSGGVVGVAPRDGKLLWQENVGANKTATIPTPVIKDNDVYVTSDYRAGCALVKLTAEGGQIRSEVVYKNRNMENHHGGVVLVDGCIYGWSGNSGARGPWVCQDFMGGERIWTSEKFRQSGSLTCADGMLYCYGQNDGTAVLAEASRDGWKEHGRFVIPRHTSLPRGQGHVWTHPVVANGKLYLRDFDLIFCYDVSNGGRQSRR